MDASAEGSLGAPVSKKASVAQRVAGDVVKCDPTILSLLVMDDADASQILAVARSRSLPREEYAGPEMVKKFAVAAMVVWGAAEQASRLMGARQFMIGAFENQLVLLVNLREYRMLLAIRLNRSSNAEHVYEKISRLLGF